MDVPATSATYLVVVDDTPESRVALRYAALRAAHVGAQLTLLHVMRPTEFMQWGGVQAAIEAEAQSSADTLLSGIAAQCVAWTGERPTLVVRTGEATDAVMEMVAADPSIRALVLGAAVKGAPGPLVSYFAGERAGTLPCLVMIVPGGLDDARVDALA
ncbi:universal stress protein [Glacieibacterium sp.]|uniref:universal stress protein n=1 Tax=Glacieibacterium sp. TaxID=2860237 RepID=UPI003B00E25B